MKSEELDVSIESTRVAHSFPAAPHERSRHYPALDGLGGVAVLAVMLFHFTGGYKGSSKLLHAWSALAGLGWMGVDLFFVLSGFLITGILYDGAQEQNRIRNFYARRALRIFPLFYGVLVGLLLLTPLLHLQWKPGHLLYFFYLGNMIVLLAPGLQHLSHAVNLGHLWSLAVEEQFYMLWPFAVWTFRDRRTLLRMVLVILFVSPIARVMLLLVHVAPSVLSALLFTRADSLMYGAFLALWMRGPDGQRVKPNWLCVIPVIGVLVVCFLSRADVWSASPLISSVGYSLIGMSAALLVYQAVDETGWTANLLRNSVLRFFGKYSYGLYIYHGLFFVAYRHWITTQRIFPASGPLSTGAGALVGFALSIAVSMVSYHYFEKPLLRMKDRFV